MRTLILGGTFNPVHVGHLFLAEEARFQLGYERIVLVPANLPAHKEMKPEASASDRLEMLKSATKGIEYLSVDECDIRRGGVSYSVETVPDILRNHPVTGKPGFILGDDLLEGFGGWRDPARLAVMVDLIVAHRIDPLERPFAFAHRYLDNLLLPVSSSDIRRRVRSGQAFRFVVPEAVHEYILGRGLYK